jgi:hypothetical protein
MNTIGDGDYKMTLSDRRLHNEYLDLSMSCLEYMGYEIIGAEGMPAKGVVNRYYSIEHIGNDRVIINKYELIVIYGVGRVHSEKWDTDDAVACWEDMDDYLWNYHLAKLNAEEGLATTVSIKESETDESYICYSQGPLIINIMRVFTEYMKRKIDAKKEETP